MKKKIVVHIAKSWKDAEKFDERFWRRAGAAARFAATWSTVTDYLKLRGKYRGQPRLQKSVQRIAHLPHS